MLRWVATDSFWSPARRWDAHVAACQARGVEPSLEDGDFKRPHGCGAAGPAADHAHVFWTCAKIGTEAEEVEESQMMIFPAKRGIANGASGLWLRGLVPKGLTHDRIPARTTSCETYGCSRAAASLCPTLFTDAGGGHTRWTLASAQSRSVMSLPCFTTAWMRNLSLRPSRGFRGASSA